MAPNKIPIASTVLICFLIYILLLIFIIKIVQAGLHELSLSVLLKSSNETLHYKNNHRKEYIDHILSDGFCYFDIMPQAFL